MILADVSSAREVFILVLKFYGTAAVILLGVALIAHANRH